MKSLFKALVVLVICFVLVACEQSIVATSPIATSAATMTPIPSQTMITVTPFPSPTATATLEPTPTEHVRPTLIPTIDPTLVPGLLSKAFSVQTMEGVNGHKIQQITGWDYGLGGGVFYGGVWYALCPGYQWLDTNHILLYPEAGQQWTSYGDGSTMVTSVVPQLVVMNLDHGKGWVLEKATSEICNRVYWSQELKILITDEFEDENSIVSTYTYDGYRLSRYPGSLWDVSPSGTKILISEDTLIDLRTNKTIKLSWSLEDYYEPHLSGLYWTYPEETRVYRCCYFYADLTIGVSHRFERSDFQDSNGNHLDPIGLWFHQGEWVRDNKYFLVHWLAVDDGPVRYQPLFDPATKLIYDLWELAGISPSMTWRYNEVSPDGNYVWIVGFEESYLVNLTTFESRHFPYNDPYTYTEGDWSADSKFIWFETHIYSGNESAEFQILSIADGKLSPIPVTPLPAPNHRWHPTKASVVYPAADKDALIFLDASTMSYRELPFTLLKLPNTYVIIEWSPTGEKLALAKEDGSVWQVDYPSLENLEQLTPSLPDVRDLNWSPDGDAISFISDSDIYIVETIK
jgi:hypothetical protein